MVSRLRAGAVPFLAEADKQPIVSARTMARVFIDADLRTLRHRPQHLAAGLVLVARRSMPANSWVAVDARP